VKKDATKSEQTKYGGSEASGNKSQEIGPQVDQKWVGAGGVILLALFVWAFSGAETKKEPESKTKIIYTDGVSVEQPKASAQLYEVLWEKPLPVFEVGDQPEDTYDPAVSADGRLIVFVKGLPKKHPKDDGSGAELYFATRENDHWSDPQPLVTLNTSANELGPELSRDGNKIFFYSDRPGGLGGTDIWLSQRDAGGEWGEPQNLGQAVNSPYDELDPAVFSINSGDVRTPKWQVERLYFASSRPRGKVPPKDRWKGTARESIIPRTDYDLFAADTQTVEEGGLLSGFEFVAAKRLGELNTQADDSQPVITRRGDFIYFASNRQGGEGGFDIYRSRIFDGKFQSPANLGVPINSSSYDTDPALTMEGHRLFFSSDRHNEGGIHQIYFSTWREVFANNIPIKQDVVDKDTAEKDTTEKEPAEKVATEPSPHASSSGFYHFFNKYKWWILLLLLSLMALLWLLRNFLDESLQRKLSIMQKCLLASVGLHVLLAFLLTLWVITEAIYKEVREQLVEISLDSGALAAQKEEEALRKPMEANLDRASAAIPIPEQLEQQPATQAEPEQLERVDQPEAIRPDITAILPPEIKLPEDLVEAVPLPKLPNQIPAPATPQLQQPELEIAKAVPLENQQMQPVARQVQVRPQEASQADPKPNKPEFQVPTTDMEKSKSVASASSFPKVQTDPASLPLIENELPEMEQPASEQVRLETADRAPEEIAQMAKVPAVAQVNQVEPTAQTAKPTSLLAGIKPVEPAQSPAASTAKSQDVVPTEETAKPIETAQVDTNLPKAMLINVVDQNMEKARVSPDAPGQMAKVISDQKVKPADASNTEALPSETSLKAVEMVKTSEKSAATNSQVEEAKDQPANLSTVQLDKLLPQSNVVQVQNIELEKSQTKSEPSRQIAGVVSRQDIDQTEPATTKSTPVETNAKPVKLTASAEISAANKATVDATVKQPKSLDAASVNRDLPPVTMTNPDKVTLEEHQSEVTIPELQTLVSGRQKIVQKTAVFDVATPIVLAQENNAAVVSPSESAVAKSQVANTVEAASKLLASRVSTKLPQVSPVNPDNIKLEQSETSPETVAMSAKVDSEQEVDPTEAKAEQTAPLKDHSLVQLAVSRNLNPLMTTNAVQATSVQASPARLDAVRLSQQLPELVSALTLPLQLERGKQSTDAPIKFAKASADTKISSSKVQSSMLDPLLKNDVPEIAPKNDRTAANPQLISATKSEDLNLKTVSIGPSLPQMKMPKVVDLILESTVPTISKARTLVAAKAGQNVEPANRLGASDLQSARSPSPIFSMANASTILDVKRQYVETSSTAVGARKLVRFQSTDQLVEPLVLPNVVLEPGGGRVVAGEVVDRLKTVSSSGGTPVAAQNDVRIGKPIFAQSKVEEPHELVGEVELPKNFAEPELGVVVRPLELMKDPTEVLQLPDINVLANAPLLEAPRKIDDPFVVRHDPKKRLDIIDRLGGSKETEAAILRSLDWFTNNQKSDGHWEGPTGAGKDRFTGKGADHDLAATGMAMLAYMGWGAKHNEDGPFQKPLEKAVNWMAHRVDENGDMRPFKGANYMYDQGIAAIALAEAYSLTKDPRLKPLVERIVGFTIRAQSPIEKKGRRTYGGGWRYRPYGEQGYHDRGDTSVTGWQVMALKSAKLGGIDVSDEVFKNAQVFLKSVSSGKHNGAYGYSTTRDVKPAMIAEAMFCQQLMGMAPTHPRMQESARLILRNLPDPGKKFNFYYWYYGCLALHQHQGSAWKAWNTRMRPIFLDAQIHKPGNHREHGSWKPQGEWGSQSGRCITTAMATLSLEVYYRYLPLYTPSWVKDGGAK